MEATIKNPAETNLVALRGRINALKSPVYFSLGLRLAPVLVALGAVADGLDVDRFVSQLARLERGRRRFLRREVRNLLLDGDGEQVAFAGDDHVDLAASGRLDEVDGVREVVVLGVTGNEFLPGLAVGVWEGVVGQVEDDRSRFGNFVRR